MDSVKKYFELKEDIEDAQEDQQKKYKFSRKQLENLVFLVKYNKETPSETLLDIFLNTKS